MDKAEEGRHDTKGIHNKGLVAKTVIHEINCPCDFMALMADA
jgi:hypothetical protein